MAVQRSVVKWFDAKKGYGFIVHPEGEGDIFVHYSAIVTDKRFRTLRTGQVVAFELCDGPKGLHAQNVTEVERPEHQSDGSPYNMEFSPSGTYTPSEQAYQRGL